MRLAPRFKQFRRADTQPWRSCVSSVGLFGTTVEALNPEDLALGQALADVASVALVQHRAAADRTTFAEQLQTVLATRVALEQAEGVLAQKGGLDMDLGGPLQQRCHRARRRRSGKGWQGAAAPGRQAASAQWAAAVSGWGGQARPLLIPAVQRRLVDGRERDASATAEGALS